MRRLLGASVLASILNTALSIGLGAQAAPAAPDLGARLARAIDALRAHQDSSGVVGLTAAIAVDGRLVWTGGFGYADLQNRVPADAATVSRIGSISKPIAAAAAMAVWDDGRLDLDAPISRYLPSYPEHAANVTMRQLMSHTAGVRHYRGDEFLANTPYDDVMKPMEVFWRDPLLFRPGSDYSYSTYGWTVVSAVTEAAAGRPFLDVLYDDVIRPLGLMSLQPEWQDPIIPHHASFYVLHEDGTVTNAQEVDLSNKWAGGGLVSNAADLVNFALGLMHGKILSQRALAESWRQQTPAGEQSYGLGWNVAEIGGRRVVSHSGGSMGATAMLVVLPDDGVVVSVLGNTGGIGHAGIARRVALIVLGES